MTAKDRKGFHSLKWQTVKAPIDRGRLGSDWSEVKKSEPSCKLDLEISKEVEIHGLSLNREEIHRWSIVLSLLMIIQGKPSNLWGVWRDTLYNKRFEHWWHWVQLTLENQFLYGLIAKDRKLLSGGLIAKDRKGPFQGLNAPSLRKTTIADLWNVENVSWNMGLRQHLTKEEIAEWCILLTLPLPPSPSIEDQWR